jgi:uncharacterized protein YdhG (YjbR/CyaY superfamily)
MPVKKKSKPTRSAGEAKAVRSQVQTYLKSLPPNARRRLGEVRALIRGSAPGAVEGFSYGIPGYRLDGKPLVWYAAFKEHTSLYPMTEAIRRAHAEQLQGYKTARGTVQFPLADPLPAALVKRLIKARLAELRTRGK